MATEKKYKVTFTPAGTGDVTVDVDKRGMVRKMAEILGLFGDVAVVEYREKTIDLSPKGDK